MPVLSDLPAFGASDDRALGSGAGGFVVESVVTTAPAQDVRSNVSVHHCAGGISVASVTT